MYISSFKYLLLSTVLTTSLLNVYPLDGHSQPVFKAKQEEDFAKNYQYIDKRELSRMAEHALGNHNYTEALNIFNMLRTEDPEWAAYGSALAHTQQGAYERALTTLQSVPYKDSRLNTAAQTLTGDLYLLLAATALAQDDKMMADKWLNMFKQSFSSHPQMAQADVLERRIKLLSHTNISAQNTHMLKVGVLLPLSGNLDVIGKDILHGMQMALWHTPEAPVILYPIDTQSTTYGTEQAVQEALSLNVNIILGPLSSAAVETIKPYTQQAGIPVIAFSTDESVQGPRVHLINHLPANQARSIARYAISMGKKRFAALVPSSPYGYEALDAFTTEVEGLGATMVNTQFFNPKNIDINTTLKSFFQLDVAQAIHKAELEELEAEHEELAEAMPDDRLKRLNALRNNSVQSAFIDFDALFIPAPADKMPIISSQMAFYDVTPENVMMLGTATWQSETLFQGGGDYVAGMYFAAPPINASFKSEFSDIFQEDRFTLAPLGYDAVIHVKRIANALNNKSANINDLLYNNQGFSGITGPATYYANGPVERAYSIYKVQKNGFEEVLPSPAVLPPPLPHPLNPRARASFGINWF